MKRINNSKDLETEILRLKAQREIQYGELTTQMSHSYKELRPSRILKRVFTDIKREPVIKENIFESVLSLTGGYFSKRLLVGKSNSFFKSIMGYLVQIGATKLISSKIITPTAEKQVS